MSPGQCLRGLPHRFDSSSGWCVNGCGWRDDGRSIYQPTPTTATYPPLDCPDVTEPRRSVREEREAP
jgi:hypothetical protein